MNSLEKKSLREDLKYDLMSPSEVKSWMVRKSQLLIFGDEKGGGKWYIAVGWMMLDVLEKTSKTKKHIKSTRVVGRKFPFDILCLVSLPNKNTHKKLKKISRFLRFDISFYLRTMTKIQS